MHMLDLVANACGAVSFFMLALTIHDKFGRTLLFVLAGLNLVVLVFRLFF